ncbi:MAG: DUF6263 family protein [Ferruginibacter sp.]|nr:hypothetical protein [Ferruginibacter sp.]
MKKIVLLSLCFATFFAQAQTIKLENEKVIKLSTKIILESESPMGGTNKSEINTVNTLKITAVEEKLYKANSTLSKMQMNGEMMGQTIKFDSDNKADMDGQMGQMLGSKINTVEQISINKTDGKVEKTDAKDDENNAGAMLTGGDGNVASSAFFVIPADKKIGDKWTVTTTESDIKSIKNYELQSMKDNMATVLLSATSKGTTTKEANGMSMEMTIDSKSNGTIVVNNSTGIVKEIIINDETTGSMEVMGQTMPLNKKSRTTVTVE